MKRRDFMKNLGLGATTLSFGSLPVVLSACETNDSNGKEAQNDDQILFIGDDIAIADTQYGKVQGYILNKVYIRILLKKKMKKIIRLKDYLIAN